MDEQLRQAGPADLVTRDSITLAGVLPDPARSLRRLARAWWTGWVRYASATYPWR